MNLSVGYSVFIYLFTRQCLVRPGDQLKKYIHITYTIMICAVEIIIVNQTSMDSSFDFKQG